MLYLSCAAASAATNMFVLRLVLTDPRSLFYIAQGAATPMILDSLSSSLPSVVLEQRMMMYPLIAAGITYALYQTVGKSIVTL